MVLARDLCHSRSAHSSRSFSFCFVIFFPDVSYSFEFGITYLGTLCIYAFGPAFFWNYVVDFTVVYNVTTYLVFYVFA